MSLRSADPGTTGTIPDAEIFRGGWGGVDLLEYFLWATEFSISSSDSSAVSVCIVQDHYLGEDVSWAEYSGVGIGSAEITITGTGVGTPPDTLSFTVTVVNRAPASVGDIENQSLPGGGSGSVDVSSNFTDADDDPLTYTVASSNSGMVTASTSGNEVRFRGRSRGSPRLTVTASDGYGGTATQRFTVTVGNSAPQASGSVTNQSVEVGASVSVDLSNHFTDVDSDALTYTASWSDSSAFTASLTASVIEFTGQQRGRATVTVKANDGHGGTAEQTFKVTVPNRPPKGVGSIDNQSVTVGGNGNVNVAPYFTDADGDALAYSVAWSDSSALTVSVTGSVVAFEGDARGNVTVTVTASDGHGGTVEQAFTVTVPNQVPTPVGTIADQSVTAGGSGSVDVSGHFADADSDALSYAVEWTDSTAVTVSVDGNAVEFEGDARGSTTVTVTASDGHGGTAEQSFMVTVANQEPTAVGSIAAQSVAVGGSGSVDVSGHFTDADSDPLSYTVEWTDSTVVTVTVNGSAVEFSGDARGSATVTVTASDGHGGTAEQAFTVTVPNQTPGLVGSIADQSVTVGGSGSVNVAAYFSDADGDALTYAVVWSDSSVITASVTGSVVEFTGDALGSADVTVTASDGHEGSADQAFAVTVVSSNRAPAFSPTTLQRTVAENSAAGTNVGAPVTASDADDDALAYSFATGGEESSFEINGTTGQITVGTSADLDYESGNTSFTVQVVASDGTLADTATVTIGVTNADDPGAVTLDASLARVGVQLTATLTDQDGSQEAGKTRKWQRSADGSTGWADISGATTRFYTPVADDEGKWLKAVFTYTDGHGPNKSAESAALRVTGPNVAPVFPAALSRTVPENSAAGTDVGAPVTATDGNDDTLTYSFVVDGDSSSFEIDGTTGQITVGSSADLDYESGTTSLTVQAVVSDRTLADTATVTINVTDADDPGVVTLDASVARVGVRLSAALSDQDGSQNAGKTRKWQRSANGSTGWTDISGATTRFYTPVASDEGMWLKAVFTYTDGHGPNKQAESSAVRVTGANVAPAFSSDALTRSVPENAVAETEVGAAVTATDGNGDVLAYSFAAGGDAASFEIDESTGQITVGSGTALDYESGNTSLTVQAVASDGTLADTATVTISVTNEDEPGAVTLDASVARVGTAITATLADEDVPDAQATTIAWQSSADGGTTWADIASATSTSYTPVSSDEGTRLRAAFSYTDGHGAGKLAESDAVNVTGPNVAPVYSPAAVERAVAENSAAGTDVGAPVTASDANNDALAYSVAAGGDASSFEIHGTTGQITVGRGVTLDYESGSTSFTVQVVASDGTLADTATVTISVTDADDPGVVTLDAAVARVGSQLTAVLTDQDGSRNAGKKRKWQRSASGGVPWTNISGANSRFYTPVAADEGMWLRAVFTYADGHGPNKRAVSPTVPAVGATTPVVSFGAEEYSVTAGGSVDVAVGLSPAATAALSIPVAVGGSAAAATRTVTFEVGDTDQTLSVSAVGLAAGDTVTLSFGTLPSGVVAVAPSDAFVVVSEIGADMSDKSRRAALSVEYAELSYTASAGGPGAGVTVRMSPAADREVIVPVTVAGTSAGTADLGVPATLRFAPGDSMQAFTVEAPAEVRVGQYTLGFGELPEAVKAGAIAASVIDIVDGAADAARLDESLQVGLAVLGRSVAEEARRSISGRMEAAMRGGSVRRSATGSAGAWATRALTSLAGPQPDAGAAAGRHARPTGKEAVERLLPQLSLSADMGLAQDGTSSRFSVWGEGSAQGFRGEPGRLSYEGGMRALTVGADAQVGSAARLGVSVMRTGGEFDYTTGSLEGTLDHGMTTVHPYLFFQPSAGLGLWAMAGYGTGQLESTAGAPALDATLNMISGGARLPLVRNGGFGLGLTGDVFGVRMSAGNGGAEGAATRGRALLEATYAASGLRLGVEAGGRYDGGDADTGAGVETGASVGYAGSAVDLAMNGRMAFGSSGHREWGVALRLAWDPGAKGRGFRLAVSPASGQDRSGMRGLLEGNYATPGHGGGSLDPAQRFDAEAGYGFAAFGGGSLDTYSRLSTHRGGRTLTLGTGYDLARALRFSFEAVSAQTGGRAPTRQGIRASVNLRF
ncbi:MAG: cadherin domain-containing protein [Gemmatimonadetes bacterium]|nr:cadherin domain-containing protein [Candidatus Palauibacter rhopaloidicola]